MSLLAQKIDALFVLISRFESANSKKSGVGFANAFTEALDYIVGQFEMSHGQADLTASVDDALCQRVREADPASSTLRLVAVNALGMFLSVRGQGLPKFKALYDDMGRLRPENLSWDAEYIEHVLVPRLTQLQELNDNEELAFQLLLKMASYLEAVRAPRTLPGSMTRTAHEREPLPKLLLGFARRRIANPGKLLVESPGTIEYGLKREKFFEWMRDEGQRRGIDVAPFLVRLQLLPPETFWSRVRKWFVGLFSGVGRARGAMTERLPAAGWFWSGFWIVIAVLLTIGVPVFWFFYYQARLESFNANAAEIGTRRIQVVTPAAGEGR